VKRFSLEFPGVLESLDEVAAFICQSCRSADPPGVPERLFRDIDLAASEAVTNAIRHGSRFEGDLLSVTVEISDRLISLQVVDHGPGFDLAAMTDPDLDQPAEGGYGVYIIKRLMDEVSYRRGPDANVLVMVKRLCVRNRVCSAS